MSGRDPAVFLQPRSGWAGDRKFASPANICGGKGIRTPGLLIANETLYQLSYTPILPMKTGSGQCAKKTVCPTTFTHRYMSGWK